MFGINGETLTQRRNNYEDADCINFSKLTISVVVMFCGYSIYSDLRNEREFIFGMWIEIPPVRFSVTKSN